MRHGQAPDDSELQALYRAAAQAGGEEPDAQLDARILAAARAASGERLTRRQRPPAAWWKRWLVPVSVTAVAVLGVSLTLRVNEEQAAFEAARQMGAAPPASRSEAALPRVAEPDSTAIGAAQRADRWAEKAMDRSVVGSPAVSAKALPDTASERAAAATVAPKKERMPGLTPTPAAPPPPPPVQAAVKMAAEPPPPAAAPRDLPAEVGASFEKKERREFAPPAPATSVVPPSPTLDDRASQAAKAAAELREMSARRARSIEFDQARSVGAAASGVTRQSLSPARQNEESAAIEASPERWLEKIRDLRRANRLTEAKQELDRFRLRYPDFTLPSDLK